MKIRNLFARAFSWLLPSQPQLVFQAPEYAVFRAALGMAVQAEESLQNKPDAAQLVVLYRLWSEAYQALPGASPERELLLTRSLRTQTELGQQSESDLKQDLAQLKAAVWCNLPETAARPRSKLAKIATVSLILAALGAGISVPFWPGSISEVDYARNKPFVTSSKAEVKCHPVDQGGCGSRDPNAFFMTEEEYRPYYQVDLRKTRTISVVEVKNTERNPHDAIPLLIEGSIDGIHWNTLTKRNEVFSTWMAVFKPTKAHYVRLTVEKKAHLHLNRVAVR